MVGVLCRPRAGSRGVLPGVEVGAHFSFGAWFSAECSWELSGLLNSVEGRQAARNSKELAETRVCGVMGLCVAGLG